MGNLKAAERKISEVFSEWMPDERDGMKKVFRAYHDDLDPKPEPPEFKPEQWVMTALPGNKFKLRQIKCPRTEFLYSWTMKDHTWWTEENMRLATDAEKFRPGAVVRYEHGDGTTFLEGIIDGTIVSNTGELIRIHFALLGNDRSLDIDRCTLITAAPAGEADDD